MRPKLSIIVPVLNEAAGLGAMLDALQVYRQRGAEIIVVDGGSSDGGAELARHGADHVLQAPRGRAAQMNAGAALARGQVLLFLHADTQLPATSDSLMLQAINRGALWGRFDVRIAGRPWMLKLVAAMMNLRSRSTGIATGDQALFVRQEAFAAIGGFPLQPLMEDIELSRRLLRLGRPACLDQQVLTSGRRWEQHGVWRTIVLMWRLRWRYWRGVAPEVLAREYN